MQDLIYHGQPVHVRMVRNLGAVRLTKDCRHRLLLSVPEGAPDRTASLFLGGLTASCNPVIHDEQRLFLMLQTAASAFCSGLDVTVPEISLFWSNTLWGACDWQHGTVHLHRKLINYPDQVVSEALLHECCHLRIHDHSPAFWQLMTEQMSDWPYWEGLLRQSK